MPSPVLAKARADARTAAGVEVVDLGLCGTEEMYFATTLHDACGGIEVTASHNPIKYNGMKMVKAGSALRDPATEMAAIRALAESGGFSPRRDGGRVRPATGARAAYVARVLSFVDVAHSGP